MAKNRESEPQRIGPIAQRVLKDIRNRMKNENETEKTDAETEELSLNEKPVEGLSRRAGSCEVSSQAKQESPPQPENPKDTQ